MRTFIRKAPEENVAVGWKLDGITAVARYQSGSLTRLITRGNGEDGEDITHNARLFKNLPVRIGCRESVEVRGEAVVSHADFAAVNESLDDPFMLERSFASGMTRRLDTAEKQYPCCLSLIAFELVEPQLNTLENAGAFLKEQGFTVVDRLPVKAENAEEIVSKFNPEQFAYPVDGLVFEYNDLTFARSLGRTGHHERCRFALKWQDETVTTRLVDVVRNTTRSGIVSLKAQFEPVTIDGSVVQFATLHNYTRFRELKLGIGDELSVYKANMIIPAVDENLTQSGTFELDMTCPCCGSPLEIRAGKSGSEMLYCSNAHCAARNLEKFEHLVSKECLNIKGLAGKTLETLIEHGFIQKYADIWRLEAHKDTILSLPGWGAGVWKKLDTAIAKARHTTLARLIPSMGIPMVGKTAGKAIHKYFKGNAQAFIFAVDNGFDFHELPDFGDVMCNNLADFFADAENRIAWNELVSVLDITPDSGEISDAASAGASPLLGKTIVATGSFQRFSRDSINQFIESLGAVPKSSVSKKTDFVVAGEKAGSKLEKAKTLGIKIISEEEFLQMANANR